jgi:hypothetical protein
MHAVRYLGVTRSERKSPQPDSQVQVRVVRFAVPFTIPRNPPTGAKTSAET